MQSAMWWGGNCAVGHWVMCSQPCGEVVAHVIIVSPPVQIGLMDLGLEFGTAFRTGIRSKGTGLGTRA